MTKLTKKTAKKTIKRKIPSNKIEVTGGMEPFVKDEKDFDYGAITELGKVDLSVLPKNFEIPLMFYHNQKTSDFCTGFVTTEVSEDQEGVVLHPEFAFMAGKRYRGGDYRSWGNSINAPLTAAIKWGTIALADAPDMVLGRKSRDFLANWKNWPKELWDKAEIHKKHSYFSINKRSGGDLFDSIRLALWENKDKKRTIVTGSTWRGTWNRPKNGILPKKYPEKGTGHAFEILGWVTLNKILYLKVYFNYGKSLGKDGFVFMSRSIANKELVGAWMFVDIPVDVAKIVSEYAGKAVSSSTPPKIYLIEKGKKRHIPNMNLLNALGFEDNHDKNGFSELSASILYDIPNGEPIDVADLSKAQQELFHRNKL